MSNNQHSIYSGVQVNRAGDKLRQDDLVKNEDEFARVLDVLSFWRIEHDLPLKRAFELVQRIALTKDRKAIFAKRLKRSASIAKKLRRFQSMELSNMQDIGGCRAIVSNQKKLQQVLRELKRQTEFRWSDGKYRIKDYIEEPKDDGYRSVHILGRFAGDRSRNRKIEVQLRTFMQHYWATALEIVDLFTDQALKSNQGDRDWRNFFKCVAEHFALMESIHLFESMDSRAKVKRYRERLLKDQGGAESAKVIKNCCKRLRVIDKLEAFAGSLFVVNKALIETNRTGYVLLKIDIEGKTVETTVFSTDRSKQAEMDYTRLESETAKQEGVVVALVSSTAVGGIKEAYPNYFADSSNFVQHLNIIIAD